MTTPSDAVAAERRVLLDRLIRLLAIREGYGDEDSLPGEVRSSLAVVAWSAYQDWAASRCSAEATGPGGTDRIVAELEALCGLISDLADLQR
jgi:hypothetical protein